MSTVLKIRFAFIIMNFVFFVVFLTGCGSDDDSDLQALSWTVNESQVSTFGKERISKSESFQANLILYTYTSRITYDKSNSSFIERGEFDMTEYRNHFIPEINNGYRVPSLMDSGSYRFIGDFSITGKVSPSGAIIDEGTINLYLDLTPHNASRNKDILIGSAANLLSGGAGTPQDPNALGSFEAVYDDFTLTAEGQRYWNSPHPFYLNLDFFGDVLTSTVSPDGPNSYDTTGRGGAYFPSFCP